MEWIIFAAIAIPILGVIAWVVLDDSFVRIEPGQLGLLLVKGRATDIALQPGPHWVPALRRRTIETYPSVECVAAGATRWRRRPATSRTGRSGAARICLVSRGLGQARDPAALNIDVTALPDDPHPLRQRGLLVGRS